MNFRKKPLVFENFLGWLNADEAQPYTVEQARERWERWGAQPHDGDCIKKPNICLRCWVDYFKDGGKVPE